MEGDALRMKVYSKLVMKVANARFCEEMRIFKEKHTARGMATSLRGGLKPFLLQRKGKKQRPNN